MQGGLNCVAVECWQERFLWEQFFMGDDLDVRLIREPFRVLVIRDQEDIPDPRRKPPHTPDGIFQLITVREPSGACGLRMKPCASDRYFAFFAAQTGSFPFTQV